MAENIKPQSTNPEPTTPVDYAFWDVPGASFKVIYSLPLFHEIDFAVNEGYRKIPHGGIEVGGLLFGTIEKEAVRIEAFRPIECEHLSGPSWNLSEKDLAKLKEQMAATASDEKLANLRPVGWFLARTRSPLELTEVEAKQFDQFFPQPFQLSVLVKPERFQPTRFGFLVRTGNGAIPRDANSAVVILPLAGRSQKTGLLIPSLAAPKPLETSKRTAQTEIDDRPKDLDIPVDAAAAIEKPVPPLERKSEPRMEPKETARPVAFNIPRISPDDETQIQPRPLLKPPVEQMSEFRTPSERAARRQLSRDRARVIEEAFPAQSAPPPLNPPEPPVAPPPLPITPPPPPVPSPPLQTAPFDPPAVPSVPIYATASPGAFERYKRPRDEFADEHDETSSESVLNPKSVTALALAALLGCLVGYIAYLQLPAPVIAIDVRPVNQTIVVSWPPEETRNSMYAAIRLNDGPLVPLSADEKKSGQVSLTAAKDFKVEVVARNWVRDSRGIVRYVHSGSGNGQVIPIEAPPVP